MSLFDAGVAALQGERRSADKAGLAKAMSTLKTPTTVGPIDFTKGPVPNCFDTDHHRQPVGEGEAGQQVQARPA